MSEQSKKNKLDSKISTNKHSRTNKFISKLKRLQYSFKQIFFEKEKSPKSLNSLAAKVLRSKKEIEKIQPYLDRLYRALLSADITNIALTGTYGSGKSTVIRTFQDIHKSEDPNNEFNYLNISLASFKDEIIEKEEEEIELRERNGKKVVNGSDKRSQENFERLLEVSILQQMIYHVKPSEIPDSRFKRIVNLTNRKLIVTSICFVTWLVSAFSMFKFNVYDKINPFTWTFYYKDLNVISFLIISVFLGGLTYIIFKLIRTFGNSRISKINIKGELELGESVDKSILNQHLDEIIYFFQKTKFNVVVIEDLDRFRDTEIFTKLREINLLLNNSDLIQRKIVFVYAIRDDMFQGQERTKFFDYIIPIIPFINPSNASDKLAELLEEEDLLKVFSKSFIDDVVTFIDDIDMRLLTNIIQEYLVYKESLKHELTQDNLLSIIIYKNIYPRDFSKLHKNEGDLYDFITNKAIYVKDAITKLDEEITLNSTLISNIEKEKLDNLKELKEVYLYRLLSQLRNPFQVFVKGEAITVDKLMEEDNFSALLQERVISYNSLDLDTSYRMYRARKTNLGKSFSAIEKEVNNRFSYIERVERINSLNDNKLEELKEQNESLEERKEEIGKWSIKQIFQNEEVSNYLGSFEDSLLMKSLLVNGYINENYLDYISLFHEVSITKGDYIFIRKVKSGSSLDFDYKIEKIENVIKKIDETHFEKVAILNHQIVEFILINKNRYKTRYKSLGKLLNSEHKKVIDFIDSYKRSEETNNNVLFKELPNVWKGIWSFIIAENNKFSEKKTNEYFQLIVANAIINQLEKLNNLKSLKHHFSKLTNLGSLIEDKNLTDKLKSIASSFQTKFDNISELLNKNEVLYRYVVSNNNYKINNTNLLAIVNSEGIEKEDFENSNYSTIKNLNNQQPLNYIERYIESYVLDVYLQLPNTEESEDSLISLLNNSDLLIQTRKKILENTIQVFQNLSSFKDIEIKEEILNQYLISIKWENVMDYFNSYTNENMDSILINYLNTENVYKELAKSNLSSLDDDEEVKKKLALSIIYCDELSLSSHTKLRTCKGSNWTGLKLKGLSYDKVESMIKSKFITLSLDYFDKTKEDFPGLHINLIEKSFNTFIKNYDEYEMDEEDHLFLLQSNFLLDSQKRQFLDTLNEDGIVENNGISNAAIKVYVNEKVDSLDYSFLYRLFNAENSNELRIQLFNLNANNINKTEARNLIEQLGYPYHRLTKPRKQAKLTNNQMNLEFTNILKSYGILSSNREVKGKIKAVASI